MLQIMLILHKEGSLISTDPEAPKVEQAAPALTLTLDAPRAEPAKPVVTLTTSEGITLEGFDPVCHNFIHLYINSFHTPPTTLEARVLSLIRPPDKKGDSIDFEKLALVKPCIQTQT